MTPARAAFKQVFRMGSHSCTTVHDAQDGFEGREGHRTPFRLRKKYSGWLECLTSFARPLPAETLFEAMEITAQRAPERV